jgi:hypothetical protein
MHSAVVVVKIPEKMHDQLHNERWYAFLADVDKLRQHQPDPLRRQQGVSRLGENVWLVNFIQNPAALVRLVSCSSEHELPYGILQLDAQPQWLPAGFDPSTMAP